MGTYTEWVKVGCPEPGRKSGDALTSEQLRQRLVDQFAEATAAGAPLDVLLTIAMSVSGADVPCSAPGCGLQATCYSAARPVCPGHRG